MPDSWDDPVGDLCGADNQPWSEPDVGEQVCSSRRSSSQRSPPHVISPTVSPFIIYFVALTTAAASFINSNYSGSEFTAFITLTAGFYWTFTSAISVCVFACVCVPAREGKADKSRSESVKRVICSLQLE